MKRFTAVSVVTRRAACQRAVRGRTLQQPFVAESTKLRFRKGQEVALGRGVGCVTDAAVLERHGTVNVARDLAKGGVTSRGRAQLLWRRRRGHVLYEAIMALATTAGMREERHVGPVTRGVALRLGTRASRDGQEKKQAGR